MTLGSGGNAAVLGDSEDVDDMFAEKETWREEGGKGEASNWGRVVCSRESSNRFAPQWETNEEPFRVRKPTLGRLPVHAGMGGSGVRFVLPSSFFFLRSRGAGQFF